MIKRYNFEVASQFKITDQIVYVEARPSKNGKYVRYSDYLKLKEAVKRLRKIEGNKPLHPVQDGLLIDARAEVDHLLNPPRPGDNGYGVITEHDLD